MSDKAPRHITLETIGKPTLVLRAATHADIPMLQRWDRDPTVIASVSDDPNETVAFGEENDWVENIDLYQRDVWEYWIAELDGRPIGAMQLCDPHREPTHYWGDIEPNLRALDIWIGEADARGQGHGETMMRLGIVACFEDPAVTAIVIDPLASNTRAHAFYQRLGFVPTERRMFGDDDTLVHRLTRSAWSQLDVCRRFGATLMPVEPDDVIGVSRNLVAVTDERPIHGLRHPPEKATSGWYLWTGELSHDPDFFVPLHASHLMQSLPDVSRYLGLAPGWRFLLGDGHEDVWFDSALLNTSEGE